MEKRETKFSSNFRSVCAFWTIIFITRYYRRRTFHNKIGWSSHEVNKSSSDTELAQSKKKNRKRNKSKEIWPLLEGLTVDELARYRRRRVQGQPKDNLQLYIEAENEDLVSEYRQAFRARSEESLEVRILLCMLISNRWINFSHFLNVIQHLLSFQVWTPSWSK